MGTKVRNSNIELLRIITICGVVVLHYNGNVAFDLVNPGSVNQYALLALEALFICAVNLFVLMSGYFLQASQQRRAVKVLELVVQVMVLGLLRYLAPVLLSDNSFSLSGLIHSVIPNNYYVTLYIAVYLISPYSNLATRKLSDRQYGILATLCGVLFALWPTVMDMVNAVTGVHLSGLYPTNTAGSQYGYSFLNFAFMYLLGGYVRRVGAGKVSTNAIGAVVCAAMVFVWQLQYPGVARAYSNPAVILFAVFIFRLFLSLEFRSKLVNTLAKGAFTCFLLHDFFLPHIHIAEVVNGSLPKLLLHILVWVVVIFLLCWLAWRVYEWVTRPVFRALEKPLAKLDAILSPTETEESV